MKMTKQPEIYNARLKADYNREPEYDKYNNLTDGGESRTLGSVEITAKSLEELKKKLHAHIDLLE
jgi:hypothetical protein